MGLLNRVLGSHSPSLYLVITAATLLATPAEAWGYRPDSPEVQAMLSQAIDYLSKNREIHYSDGGDVLIGMAMYKAGMEKSHPKIQTAIQKAKVIANRGSEEASETYTPAVACIFLCELDHEAHQMEIQKLLSGMLKRQAPNGSWSYRSRTFDDTSQTQYGILCLWTAHQAGFDVPVDAVERAADWLIRNQHSSGGWWYNPSGKGTSLAMQVTPTHSMAAAGVGSLYVCAHLLGFAQTEEQDEKGLPKAMKRVRSHSASGDGHLQPKTTNPQNLMRSAAAGNAWLDRNALFNTNWFPYYYMYGLERARSFQELVEGKIVAEPAWYNEGVKYLREKQGADGSWNHSGSEALSDPLNTAFAVLFLSRSSQKSIKKMVSEGLLIGGYGLPKNLNNAKMVDGQVVSPSSQKDVDDVLGILEGTDDFDFDPREFKGRTLSDDLDKRNDQLDRLRALVMNENPNARRAALAMLANARELDNVPALIYALGDPDQECRQSARDGLRSLSRKLDGFGMSLDPSDEQIRAAKRKWSNWYLSIRPDGELME